MLQKATMIYGIGFILLGTLSFIPALAPTNSLGYPELFGLFVTNTLLNCTYIASGVAALLCSRIEYYATLYFKVIGVTYGAISLIGLIQQDTVLGLFRVNFADNLLHLVVAAIAIYFGYALKTDTVTPAAHSKKSVKAAKA